MEMDGVLESFDSGEFSEVHSIISGDSNTVQPPPKTPKALRTPRTPRTARTANRRNNGVKRFWDEGMEFIEATNLARSVVAAKRKMASPIWKLGREGTRG